MAAFNFDIEFQAFLGRRAADNSFLQNFITKHGEEELEKDPRVVGTTPWLNGEAFKVVREEKDLLPALAKGGPVILKNREKWMALVLQPWTGCFD